MLGSPPIWDLVKDDLQVVAELGDRVYSFGLAPKGNISPYAVYQVIGGSPENYLGRRPDIDSYIVQLDVYGDYLPDVRKAASALAQALEEHGYITSWRGDSTDPETRRGRISFDFEVWNNRD